MGQQYAGINNKYGKKGHLYDLSAKLLSQTKGSFMVICLENSDKFYFLHRIKCNLQTVCIDMGWVIVHQQLFNRDLVIGMGLAEKGMSDMTIFRTKNEDIYKIWKDVLHFVFLGNGLPNIDYFSYDTSFIGQDYAHDIEYYYIHDYYPLTCKQVSHKARQVRNTVYAFKDGEKSLLWAKVFSVCISKLSCFDAIKENAVLVPIPASTKKAHGRRFTRFCRELAKRLDIADGFRTLWIEFDREKMKGTIGKNKIENLTFNRIHIKGKHVLLVDDVIMTGTSLVQIGKKLLELGALSVRGVFMAKTVREAEMSV